MAGCVEAGVPAGQGTKGVLRWDKSSVPFQLMVTEKRPQNALFCSVHVPQFCSPPRLPWPPQPWLPDTPSEFPDEFLYPGPPIALPRDFSETLHECGCIKALLQTLLRKLFLLLHPRTVSLAIRGGVQCAGCTERLSWRRFGEARDMTPDNRNATRVHAGDNWDVLAVTGMILGATEPC